MDEFKRIFERQLPSAFLINLEGDHIALRDSGRAKGEGFLFRIYEEPRYIRGILEFEDYAMPLVSYAQSQLSDSSETGQLIISKHRNLKVRRQSILSEPLFSKGEAREVSWSLEFEFKKQDTQNDDKLIFSDLVLYWIFYLFPYHVEGEEEGLEKLEISKRYERSKTNRSICLAFHGFNCQACGINMRRNYGTLTHEFIQVHHVEPVSTSGLRIFDPIRDLVPLCPNCHSVAHLKNPPYTVAEIKIMLKNE
jgi:hypothetical protein